MRRWISLGALLVMLLCTTPSYGQQSGEEFSPFRSSGVQGTVTMGENTGDLEGLFGFRTRHLLSGRFFGEAGIAIGHVSGFGERSRVIPAEYRFNYLLTDRPVRVGSFHPYLYLGAGLIHRTRIGEDVEDPVLGQGTQQIPASNLWDVRRGFNPVIPVGVGASVAMLERASLDMQLGYTRSLSGLALSGDGLKNGYWGLSIGVQFGRKPRTAVPTTTVPPPAPQPEPAPEPQPEPKPEPQPEPEPAGPDMAHFERLLAEASRELTHFEVLSSGMKPAFDRALQPVAEKMSEYEELKISIQGYADATGLEQANRLVSESRARAVWLRLSEMGVSPEQMALSGEGAIEAGGEQNEQQLARDRRVELTSVTSVTTEPRILAGPVELQEGRPLQDAGSFRFALLNLDDELYSRHQLAGVAALAESQPGLEVWVISFADEPGRSEAFVTELGKARAERLRELLVRKGVEPSRVHAFDHQGDRFQELRREGADQQTIIVVQSQE